MNGGMDPSSICLPALILRLLPDRILLHQWVRVNTLVMFCIGQAEEDNIKNLGHCFVSINLKVVCDTVFLIIHAACMRGGGVSSSFLPFLSGLGKFRFSHHFSKGKFRTPKTQGTLLNIDRPSFVPLHITSTTAPLTRSVTSQYTSTGLG